MTYKQAVLKFWIESIVVVPLVYIGKCMGYFMPLKKNHRAFLFFSNADLGGAPKVNAQIATVIKELSPLIISSKTPQNNGFAELFHTSGATCMDLHKKIDNKWYHYINIIYRGIIAAWINRSQSPTVFGGECIYFYKIVPHIKKSIPVVELCHLNTWFNYSQPFIKRMNARVFSTRNVMQQLMAQYQKNNIPKKYYERLLFIDNYIDIPAYQMPKNKTLQVLYVGRGAPQKRVPLIAAIAHQLQQQQANVHFSFVGDVENVLNQTQYPYCTFYGNVSDQNQLQQICTQSDVLILTSAYEGLPLVVMQMMAIGRAIVSTAVDGIPDYVKHHHNGLLINAQTDPDIVQEGAACVQKLINDYPYCIQLGKNGRSFAEKHFSKKTFEQQYRKLFDLKSLLSD